MRYKMADYQQPDPEQTTGTSGQNGQGPVEIGHVMKGAAGFFNKDEMEKQHKEIFNEIERD